MLENTIAPVPAYHSIFLAMIFMTVAHSQFRLTADRQAVIYHRDISNQDEFRQFDYEYHSTLAGLMDTDGEVFP
jgi:hypothetical protein